MALSVEATSKQAFLVPNAVLVVRPGDGIDANAVFDEICRQYPDNRVEQNANGDVLIMAPTGGESSDQNAEIIMQLRLWANENQLGRVFESNILFLLPDGSKRGPDAAWVSAEKLRQLTRQQRQQFLPVAPDFVIELRSPGDRFPDLRQKMIDWRSNGVELGWLIDPKHQRLFIYRSGTEGVEEVDRPHFISAEGRVQGFVLKLDPIWKGLEL